MNCFKPELYQRGNSPDLDEALAASDEWEHALNKYSKRLKLIRPKLPESVREFIDNGSLHDSEILGLTTPQQPAIIPGGPNAILFVQKPLFVRQPGGMIALSYRLLRRPMIERSGIRDDFKSTNSIWLYDEFDLANPGGFTHEIFESSGHLTKISFSDFQFQRFDFSFPQADESKAGDRGEGLIAI